MGRSRFDRDPAAARRKGRRSDGRDREGWRSGSPGCSRDERSVGPPGRRGPSVSHGRLPDRREPDRPARRPDPGRPGAGDRAGVVDRLDAAGQPPAPAGRGPCREERLGGAPQDRRDHQPARAGGAVPPQERRLDHDRATRRPPENAVRRCRRRPPPILLMRRPCVPAAPTGGVDQPAAGPVARPERRLLSR